MEGVDVNRVLERFKNLKRVKAQTMQELITASFNEHDLNEIIYLLTELKYLLERR